MNELSFYTSTLGRWAQSLRGQLETRVPLSSDGFHLDDSRMTAACKWQRASLKAALIGRKLRFQDMLSVQETDWVEVLDPLHRYGYVMHQYALVWKKSATSHSFQRWMRQKEKRPFSQDETATLYALWQSGIDKKLKAFEAWKADLEQIPCVRYLEANEVAPFRLSADSQGRILQNGKIVHLQEGEKFIIILTEKNEFYGGLYKRGAFHHSSFFKGAATKVAAEFLLQEGFLLEICDKTGHYFDAKPTGGDFRMHLVLQALLALGANLERVVVKLNIHPTASYTPFMAAAKSFFELRLAWQSWYVGKVTLLEAKELLKNGTKKFVVRQCEYPIALTERTLIKSQLPIDPSYPPFEKVFWGDEGELKTAHIASCEALLALK